LIPQERPLVVPIVEGAATALAGGALGAFTGSLIGLGAIGGTIGALNGSISGWRGIYRWRHLSGWVGFVLDSTWAILTTVTGLFAHLVAVLSPRRGGYVRSLSRREDRHVYAGGFGVRPGFVVTLGNTVNRAGYGVATSARGRRLVTDHEHVHVWQARWLGPLYPLLYVVWSVVGAVVGVGIWALRRRDQPLGRVIESCAYYLNPLEWWAYSRDSLWPPPGLIPGFGWRRPLVRGISRVDGRPLRGSAATRP
jgi:hypothetical protein